MQVFLTDGTDCEVVTASTTIPVPTTCHDRASVHRTRGLPGFATPSSAMTSEEVSFDCSVARERQARH
jgi:hypothetical protein